MKELIQATSKVTATYKIANYNHESFTFEVGTNEIEKDVLARLLSAPNGALKRLFESNVLRRLKPIVVEEPIKEVVIPETMSVKDPPKPKLRGTARLE